MKENDPFSMEKVGEMAGVISEIPRLSPSVGHQLVTQSPLHAYEFHRLLGGRRKPSTDEQTKGQIFHSLLLENGAGLEVVLSDAYRTKQAKEAKEKALFEGKIPVLEPKLEIYLKAARKILMRLQDAGVTFQNGQAEQRLEWDEPGVDGPIACSGRADWIANDWSVIRDVKTGDGVPTIQSCTRSLINLGGAIQGTAYLSAASKLAPEMAGRTKMEFLFCETKPPYSVIVAEMAGTMEALGESYWMGALAKWEQCLVNDTWPGPAIGKVQLHAPAWALAQSLEEE